MRLNLTLSLTLSLTQGRPSQHVSCVSQVDPERHAEVIIGSQSGQVIRVRLEGVPIQSRQSGGLRLAKLADGDVINACTPLPLPA